MMTARQWENIGILVRTPNGAGVVVVSSIPSISSVQSLPIVFPCSHLNYIICQCSFLMDWPTKIVVFFLSALVVHLKSVVCVFFPCATARLISFVFRAPFIYLRHHYRKSLAAVDVFLVHMSFSTGENSADEEKIRHEITATMPKEGDTHTEVISKTCCHKSYSVFRVLIEWIHCSAKSSARPNTRS